MEGLSMKEFLIVHDVLGLQPQLLTPSSSKRNLAKATCAADAMPRNPADSSGQSHQGKAWL